MASRTTLSNKKQFLEDRGYDIIFYSGKMKDAPGNLRHIFRDMPAGYFVIDRKNVVPLSWPPDSLGDQMKLNALVNEAFHLVLSNDLSKNGWVFVAVKNGEPTVFDERPRSALGIGRRVWQPFKSEWAGREDGFYVVHEDGYVGPCKSRFEAIERAAIDSGRLDRRYYGDESLPEPFAGTLHTVTVAPGSYGLLTDENTILAMIVPHPQLGDMQATARMLSAAPEMYKLVELLLNGSTDPDVLPRALDAARVVQTLVLEG